MKCSEAQRLISRLLDGELAAPDNGALLAHCAGCPGCRRTMDEMEELFSAVSVPAPVKASPFFYNKVRRKIADARQPSFFPLPRWVPAVTLAAVTGIMLATGNIFGTALWSGISPETALASAAENVPGISTFRDLPQEFNGIYYADVDQG